MRGQIIGEDMKHTPLRRPDKMVGIKQSLGHQEHASQHGQGEMRATCDQLNAEPRMREPGARELIGDCRNCQKITLHQKQAIPIPFILASICSVINASGQIDVILIVHVRCSHTNTMDAYNFFSLSKRSSLIGSLTNKVISDTTPLLPMTPG